MSIFANARAAQLTAQSESEKLHHVELLGKYKKNIMHQFELIFGADFVNENLTLELDQVTVEETPEAFKLTVPLHPVFAPAGEGVVLVTVELFTDEARKDLFKEAKVVGFSQDQTALADELVAFWSALEKETSEETVSGPLNAQTLKTNLELLNRDEVRPAEVQYARGDLTEDAEIFLAQTGDPDVVAALLENPSLSDGAFKAIVEVPAFSVKSAPLLEEYFHSGGTSNLVRLFAVANSPWRKLLVGLRFNFVKTEDGFRNFGTDENLEEIPDERYLHLTALLAEVADEEVEILLADKFYAPVIFELGLPLKEELLLKVASNPGYGFFKELCSIKNLPSCVRTVLEGHRFSQYLMDYPSGELVDNPDTSYQWLDWHFSVFSLRPRIIARPEIAEKISAFPDQKIIKELLQEWTGTFSELIDTAYQLI